MGTQMNWSNEWSTGIRDMGFEAGLEPIAQNIKLSLIINEGDFPTQVEAVQVGDLAVHCNLRKEGYWQVTHVPTLTRFNVVPNGLHKQVDLIEWCKKVQAQLQECWKELAMLDQASYKERSNVKDRIMDLCQNMEVGGEQ